MAGHVQRQGTQPLNSRLCADAVPCPDLEPWAAQLCLTFKNFTCFPIDKNHIKQFHQWLVTGVGTLECKLVPLYSLVKN